MNNLAPEILTADPKDCDRRLAVVLETALLEISRLGVRVVEQQDFSSKYDQMYRFSVKSPVSQREFYVVRRLSHMTLEAAKRGVTT